MKQLKPRKPIRRQRLKSKDSVWRKALSLAEQAWKEAIKRRSGNICEVHQATCSDSVFQVDHFRSRAHAATFLLPENGTFVCRSLNANKAWGTNNAAEKIAYVVLKREGQQTVDFLLGYHAPKKYNIIELEEITENLNRLWR